MIKRETKYIIRRIIIGVGIALILGFISTCEVKAETLQCSGGLKLNGTNVTNTSTTQLAANTNYTLQMVEPGVIGSNVYTGGKYYTDYLVVTNIGFGNYTGTNNGNAFSLLNTNTTSNALGFGTNDGVWRIRVLWTATDTIDIDDTKLEAYGNTTTNWGGSVSYLGGMRIINVTCGEQANMPTNAETDAAILKAFSNLEAMINASNGAQIGALNGIENAINGGNATNRQYQQATTDAVNSVNDTMKDSSIDSPNSSISQMEQNLPTNSVISDLLTLPVRMFQNIVNAVNGTCSPFSLGSMFGTNLTLPCINIQNYLGSALWSSIDVIFCGIFVLSMRKKFVEIFENITSLKNGGNELE